MFGLILQACAPAGPGAGDEGDTHAPSAPDLMDDRLYLRSQHGRGVVAVDVDRWLRWTGDPIAGDRVVPVWEYSMDLLARAGALRSPDHVAEVEVDEGAAVDDLRRVAQVFADVGLGRVRVRPHGADGGFHPLGQGAPWGSSYLDLEDAWRAAEAAGPDEALSLSLWWEEIERPRAPAPSPASTTAWGQADPARVRLELTRDHTVVDVDDALSRLHPALALGPTRIAHDSFADTWLLVALEPLWASAALTGRCPGPLVIDTRSAPDAPDWIVDFVARRLRKRGIDVRLETGPP